MTFKETTDVSENHLPFKNHVFLWFDIETFIIG